MGCRHREGSHAGVYGAPEAKQEVGSRCHGDSRPALQLVASFSLEDNTALDRHTSKKSHKEGDETDRGFVG